MGGIRRSLAALELSLRGAAYRFLRLALRHVLPASARMVAREIGVQRPGCPLVHDHRRLPLPGDLPLGTSQAVC